MERQTYAHTNMPLRFPGRENVVNRKTFCCVVTLNNRSMSRDAVSAPIPTGKRRITMYVYV